jgi:WD40 repeat protein
MTTRYLRALPLLLAFTLLAGAGAQGDDDEEFQEQPTGKLAPWLDTGGHSSRIAQMAFGKGAQELYTVGPPGDVHEWDAETGERLRVWRFGRAANRLATSLDGKYLAVGGFAHGVANVPVWLINLNSGEVTTRHVPGGEYVTNLAFDGSGKRLAVAMKTADSNKLVIQPVEGKGPRVEYTKTGHAHGLAFDKSGKWVALGWQVKANKQQSGVRLYDASKEKNPVNLPGSAGGEPRVAFGPTGTRLVSITGGESPAARVWAVGKHDKPQLTIDDKALRQALGKKGLADWYPIGVYLRAKGEVIAAWEQGGYVRLFRINADTKAVKLLNGDISRQSHDGGMALSRDGQWLAVGTNPGYRIAMLDLQANRLAAYRNPITDEKQYAFGPAVPMPRRVGWMPEGYGIVWTHRAGQALKWQEALTHGLNLNTLERIGKEERLKAVDHGELPKNWKLERDSERNVYLTRGKKSKVKIDLKDVKERPAQVYQAKEGRRLILPFANGKRLAIVDPETGKMVGTVGTFFFPVYDVAISPNHKYLLVAGGDQQLKVFDLAAPRAPLLQVLARGGDWIAWTKKGYFAGTPGGEKLIGWKLSTAERPLSLFYPASAFRKKMYRPDVIKELLRVGTLEAALAKVGPGAGKEAPGGVKARDVESMVPPQVTITKVEKDPKDDRKWTITAVAQPADETKQGIESLKLLVDGRPLPGELSVKRLKAGEKTVTWDVPEMPAGKKVELKVLARGPEVCGVSQPKEIEVPAPVGARPALHVVSVGLTYSGDKALDLGPCPKNDATEIARQFAKSCVGKNNLFGREGLQQLLIDKDATDKGVLEALAKVKKEVKPRDLLVFFYAGHGVNEKNEFFLLTHGANLKDLPKTALSGGKLREALGDFPCQVLVLLDACHSGKAGEALRKAGYKPPTDDASRSLSDEECSVTLIAAAMGHQRALQPDGGSHGFFTEAVLKTLSRNKDVAHNRSNHQQYVHHLFSDVFDEVQALTKDRQHPMLSLPWTVESYPVRKLP